MRMSPLSSPGRVPVAPPPKPYAPFDGPALGLRGIAARSCMSKKYAQRDKVLALLLQAVAMRRRSPVGVRRARAACRLRSRKRP